MYAIQIDCLTKRYPHKTKNAGDQLSFSVHQGECFGLLGPNGAGKSTTLNLISQLIHKDSGRILIHGIDTDTDAFHTKRSLGIVPQEFNFPIFDKVEDIILNQGGYYGFTHRELKNHCQYLLERLDLWKQRHDQARTLSGGMKRRLMVARALIHQPQILILDEPTAGVDVELRRGMWEFLKEINQQGITIILTSHYLEEVELLCQRIGMIDGGRLIKQHSVRDFIELAEQQVFIIELAEPFDNHINLTDLNVISIDSQTLSFTKKQGQTLESFFVALYEAGAKISSVKPENNRLESLFIAITNKGAKNV
jgi:ABC-2 type transport system ATP-binding protein